MITRVLLTGATGFVGSFVGPALRAAGYEVVAFLRDVAVSPPWATAIVEGDLDQPETFLGATRACNAVVHLAAMVPKSWVDSSLADILLRRNALATLRLAEVARRSGLERFVYVSSGNIFGDGAEEAHEHSPIYPVDYATYYLASKVLGEFYVEHLRRTTGLSAATLRISSVYGFGMPSGSAVGAFMRVAQDGGVLVVRDGGTAMYDLVCAADVGRAVVSSLQTNEVGPFNIGGGRSYSVAQIASTVAALYHDRGARVQVEPLGQAAPIRRGFRSLGISRARAAIAFEPTSLEEGLRLMRRRTEELDENGDFR